MAPAPGTDSYRPSTNPAEDSRPRAPPNGQKAMYEFQGNRRQGRGGPPQRGEFTFRQRMRISDRPLLTDLRAFSPDPLFRGEQPTEKFRQVDDLTDSDEKDMDVSQSGDEGPPSKKLRSGPSWSNPDPYTALPPVAETQKKKQDVVKLIRKSRVLLPAVDSQSSTAAHGEDFISLDMGDSNLEGNAEDSNEAPANAPTGPKSQPLDAPTQLGKRKRGDKLPPRSRKGATLHQQGRILREWKGSDVDPSTPWFRPPATADILAGVALHQEIIDFYEWVRPQDFEQEIREELISRLQKTFSKLEPGCQLQPFGSFAAGLYLPTGDMDLVLMTRQSGRSRFPQHPRQLIFYIQSLLQREGIAVPGSVQPIAGAKVPIIKFVDAITGLKVDLSFNNNTGIIANHTFQRWKSQYPAMPILVSAIKQYLMIRGLNDVAFGGLGGFSTICLVTSLLQHQLPMGPVPNLGSLLLSFFYFYGNVFNKQQLAIRLEPPGFIRKELYTPFTYNPDKPDRLAIIDPNRADNNISGGTAEIDLIFKCFSQAYNDLATRMQERERYGMTSKSLLIDLIGGDYEAYALQRERLRRLYSDRSGPSKQPLPPTVSLSGRPVVALPNAAASRSKQSDVARGRTNQRNGLENTSGNVKPRETQKLPKAKRRRRAAEDRATRLRELRPDIANIGPSLSVEEAVKLGGYQSAEKMDQDLAKRARRMSL